MRKHLVLCLVGLALLGGCKNAKREGKTARRPGKPTVISVERDDEEMNGAMQKARQTVGEFIEHLANPKPSEERFSVKAKFAEGDDVEHMWLGEVRYDGTMFHGTVANTPLHLKNVKLGDRHSLRAEEISDWMIIDGSRLVGGYTIRVLFNRMPPEEKKQAEEECGFVID